VSIFFRALCLSMGSCSSAATVVPWTDTASAAPAPSQLFLSFSSPRVGFPASQEGSSLVYDSDGTPTTPAPPPDNRRPSADGSSAESNGASEDNRTDSDAQQRPKARRNVALKFRVPRSRLSPTASKYSPTAPRVNTPTLNRCDPVPRLQVECLDD